VTYSGAKWHSLCCSLARNRKAISKEFSSFPWQQRAAGGTQTESNAESIFQKERRQNLQQTSQNPPKCRAAETDLCAALLPPAGNFRWKLNQL
jgi:hypothetical protein